MSMMDLKSDVLKELKKHGFTVITSKDYLEIEHGQRVNGYFCSNEKEFAYLENGEPHTFVHESCHFDQYLENCPVWQRASALDYIVYGGENDDNDYTPDEIRRAIIVSRELELDCEIRTIQKMKEYRCRADYKMLIKQANAYVLSYTYALDNPKAWYEIGKEPYKDKALLKIMPGDFYTLDYTILTEQQREIMADCMHG